MPNRGGGPGGGLAKDQTFSGFCFVHPSLKERKKYRKSKRILWDKWDVKSHYRSEENHNKEKIGNK